jgi:hypothetical protein
MHKGLPKETKTIKNYYTRQQKYLLARARHQRLNKAEAE